MSEYQYKDQNAGTEPSDLSKESALHQASGLPNTEGAPQTTLQEVLARSGPIVSGSRRSVSRTTSLNSAVHP